MIETISDQWPTGGSGKPYWSLCISRISSDRVNHKYCILFLLFLDTYNVWGLIIGITIPSFDLIPDIATLLVRVISHPRDLVTRCAVSRWISPSGPRVSLRHAEEQILLLMHAPQPTVIGIPERRLSDYPFSGVATNAIKAVADDSDYEWSHSLRNRILCFIIIATWTSWHDLVAILVFW